MPKVPGLIGSYTIRSNGTCQIKISTGWGAGKGEYSCYRETLPNAHEAEKALEDITQFLKFGGGKRLSLPSRATGTLQKAPPASRIR